MEQVILKSKEATEFTHRTRLTHPETGKEFYDMKRYRFCLDNDFKCPVPIEIWEKLRDEDFDRVNGLKYHHVFFPL